MGQEDGILSDVLPVRIPKRNSETLRRNVTTRRKITAMLGGLPIALMGQKEGSHPYMDSMDIAGTLPTPALSREILHTNDPETEILLRMVEDHTYNVGVRTKTKADYALLELFYEIFVPEFNERVLLSRHTVAPIAGWEGWGVGMDLVVIPSGSILQFIRVKFMNHIITYEGRIGQ